MFLLPNDNQIDFESIVESMLDFDNKYYLDADTGKIFLETEIIEIIGRLQFKNGINCRYFFIDKVSDDEYKMMKHGFNFEIVESENFKIAKKVSRALDADDGRSDSHFIEALGKIGEGWLDGWEQWKYDGAFEEMKKWFAKLPILIREEMDHFGCDCPICQVMIYDKTSEEEVKDAFRQANFKNVLKDIYGDKPA